MRRLMRKPIFWICMLVVFSFAMNLLLALTTLNHDDWQLKGGQSLSFLSSPSNDNVMSTQTPESVLWRRMLQQQEHNTGCDPPRRTLHVDPSFQSSTQNSSSKLQPFGFRRHIEEFLDSTSKKSLRGTVHNKNNNNMTIPCFLPPIMACLERQYSVVAYSKGRNLRQLLLNLMTFQSYPTVHDIILILPSTETLLQDKIYGTRILDWNKQGEIQIVQVLESSLWSSIGRLNPQKSGVVFVNGDAHKNWNGTILKNNFEIWKQHSQSMVLVSPDTTFSLVPKVHHLGQTELYSTCPPPNGLHGTFLHRNWLCFLRHPVLLSLQDYFQREASHWNDILHVLSIIWNQLGDGHLWIHEPSLVSLDQEERNLKAIDPKPMTQPLVDDNTIPHQTTKGMSTILNYFGCSCAVTIVSTPFHMNSTCSNEHE